MPTIQQHFEQAQLAQAAYALDLQRGAFGENDAVYLQRLMDAGMSEVQARHFANTYAVVDQYTDAVTGFSATVFESNGVKYVAIRGTENLNFYFEGQIDWLTNIGDVGADGIAIAQGIKLFNYLQRLQGGAGNGVVQYEYHANDRTVTTFTGEGLGLLAPGEMISVTGHSLGGHLAMMMGRLAPDMVASVYTYNPPGFDTPLLENQFSLTSTGFFNLLRNAPIGPITGQIGASWDDQITFSINVEGDVIHSIGYMPGSQQTIFTETTSSNPSFFAHFVGPMVDFEASSFFRVIQK